METEPREHSDLLSSNLKGISRLEPNGTASHDGPSRSPPDGGFRAYTIVVASFLTNGLLFGVINCYSVIYPVLLAQLKGEKAENAEVLASLVGPLAMGTIFILSPLSGVLTGLLGLRLTAVIGGSIAAVGLLLSSFAAKHVYVLCFTYGILYGLGASLAYTPSLAILGHYFKKYLGLVNGIVTIGSCVFTVFMLTLMEYMIKEHGLDWTFRLLALITVGIAFCGLLYKPTPLMVIEKSKKADDDFKSLLKTVCSVQLWKIKKYRLWCISMPIALFGYFVPYVHIQKFIDQDLKLDDVDHNLPLKCIAIGSGIGRLAFGFLADRPGIDRIVLQQISFYVMGTLTIILPFVRSFWLLVAISLGMGLCEGGFISLIGPIAFELCGSALAAQAIGCLLGVAATPISVGPPVAGALYSYYGSYTVPFVLAGMSPLIGATFMFTIYCKGCRSINQATETNSNISNGQISLKHTDVEKNPASLLKAKEDNLR